MGNDNILKTQKENSKLIKEEEADFDNIKSKYVLKQIFDNLKENKTLQIIRYNSKMKNKLDKNIDDYKKCSEIYSKIEIEIIPKKKKYGKFINIINKEEKKYFHRYFNNDKNEIKRNDINKNDRVKKIIIKIDSQIKSFCKLFEECECIESIYFKKFYRKNIIDMSYMFYRCFSLQELNITNFNTNSVTNMSYMFYGCSLLKELNLSNFDTSNVTDMKYMFAFCRKLEKLKIDNFNTKNVIYMSNMFECCSSINYIPVYNFNTYNVRYMSYMFYGCSSLKDIVLSNFIINSTHMKGMFCGCPEELIIKIQFLHKNFDYKAFSDDRDDNIP